MIRTIDSYFEHGDPRGRIKGIINTGEWEEINMITSDADVVRGNHYHKYTLELFFIIRGEIKVHTQRVKDGKLCSKVAENIVREGDIFIVDPMVNHIFYTMTDSAWINVLSKRLDTYEPDMYRV